MNHLNFMKLKNNKRQTDFRKAAVTLLMQRSPFSSCQSWCSHSAKKRSKKKSKVTLIQAKKKKSSGQHAEAVSSFPPWPGGESTYIQPVFDCRVQHGEVCEEDPQVGHRALGAGLYGEKENTQNLQKRVKVPSGFSFFYCSQNGKFHKKGRLQSGCLQPTFKRALMTRATQPSSFDWNIFQLTPYTASCILLD